MRSTPGRLPPGERLPPQRDLAFRLEVSIGTIGRAYDLLAQRGLTRGEVGRGTVVLGRGEPLRVAAGEEEEVGGLIDLTSNFPAPVPAQASLGDLLPIQESAVEVLADLLRYPNAAGALRHRAAACDWLRHLGLAAEPECTLLTNGAEGALAAAMLALARPGDAILAEQLCYSGLRSLAARLGQHLEPVQMDEHGIVPEALAAAVRQRGARLLVLSPTLHNPTAILTPLARREAIVAAARELDLVLVEDDVYGPLVPDRPPAFVTSGPRADALRLQPVEVPGAGIAARLRLRPGGAGACRHSRPARSVAGPRAARCRAVRPRAPGRCRGRGAAATTAWKWASGSSSPVRC